MSLQLPFKSGPAEPHTTRQDANSIILSDSNLARRLREVTDASERKANGSANGELEQLPRVISYRKHVYHGYDENLYDSEFFNETRYRLAAMKRNVEFHQIFKQLDLTDRLLDDFSCAMSREILLQGRLYIAAHYVCFNSNLLGWVTNIVIKMEEIVAIEKRSTAGLFPNGITIDTAETKYTFASFISRDHTYDLLVTAWEEAGGAPSPESSNDSGEDTDDDRSKTPRIESYLMLLDGDEEPDEDAPALVFNKDSGYVNHGPNHHAPTTAVVERDPNEVTLFDEVISAPLGMVYEVLFGTSRKFHKKFIEDHDGLEITDYGEFVDGVRSYTYRKALNYSIGPKSTRCEVLETLQHHDFGLYIVVLSSTQTPDVPLGNLFLVKTRYALSWGANNTTRFILSFFIEWTGRSWIKPVIEKQSLAGQQDAANDMLKALAAEIALCTYAALGAPVASVAVAPTLPEPKVEVAKPAAVAVAPVVKQWLATTPLLLLIVVMLAVVLLFQWHCYRMLCDTRAQYELLLALSRPKID